MDQTHVIYLIVALAFAYLAYKKFGAVWMRAKAVMFTPEAFIASLMHYAVLVSLLATWMFFKVRVMGETVAFDAFTDEQIEEVTPPKRRK